MRWELRADIFSNEVKSEQTNKYQKKSDLPDPSDDEISITANQTSRYPSENAYK